MHVYLFSFVLQMISSNFLRLSSSRLFVSLNPRVCSERYYARDAAQEKPIEPEENPGDDVTPSEEYSIDIPPHLPLQKGTAQLTYVGGMTSLIKRVKRFSLFTSAVGVCFQPVLAIKLASASTAVTVGVLAGSCVPVFVVPLALHHVCRRYVTHMYYDPMHHTFTATRLSFFLRQRDFTFSRNDVTILYNESFFKTCLIHKQPYFVDELGFLDKDVYMKFNKFDDPLDYNKKL